MKPEGGGRTLVRRRLVAFTEPTLETRIGYAGRGEDER